MNNQDRLHQIVELVNRLGFLSTKELAGRMHVTETTIRRDSEELERRGAVVRVHGGVRRAGAGPVLSTSDEVHMHSRLDMHTRQKDIVARRAAELVKEGDCIFLDGGSSAAALIPYLKDMNIKIVTHSHLALNLLQEAKAQIFTIGGLYIPLYEMSVGPLAQEQLASFNFDLAFLSCAGVSPESGQAYTAEADTMAMKKQAMVQSTHSVLLADSSKYPVRGFCRFMDTDRFDHVITNADADYDGVEYPENWVLV